MDAITQVFTKTEMEEREKREPGTGNRERGTGTEVWERIVSGYLHKKSKMAYKDQEPGIIDKREMYFLMDCA